MSDIEKKLQEYRAKKKREEYINGIKEKTKGFISRLAPKKTPVATVSGGSRDMPRLIFHVSI